MAKGFAELHPIIRENLKNIGIKDEEVTQAWGTKVKASAGFHDPELGFLHLEPRLTPALSPARIRDLGFPFHQTHL